ncbi:MAG: amino acid permease [Fusobacteriaceae bacterium]
MHKKKISTISLVMILFIGVFGFGNIANNFKVIGMPSATMLLIGSLVFFLPLCLIMAEFGSYAKDRTAGIYAWIEIGLGKKLAYLAIWSYFVANIFYLPTLATRVPTYLSFVIYGDSNLKNIPMALLATLTMIVALIVGVKYEKQFNKVSVIVGYISLVAVAIFLIGGFYVFLTGNSSTTFTPSIFLFDLSNKKEISAVLNGFAWITFAYGGSEICGTYIDKVENPEKNFSRGILFSALLIGVLYVLGILAMATFGTGENFSKVSLVNAVISGYKFMGDKLGLGIWFVRFIGIIYAVITIVALVLWSVALSKSVFSEVPEGTFPEWLTTKSERGVLKNALIFQTILALLFIGITTLGGEVAEELYYKIYDMSTMAFLVPYLFLAISYLYFRKKGLISPFQAVKNRVGAYMLGCLVIFMALVSLVFSGYNINLTISEQLPTMKLYYGGLTMFLLIGVVIKVLNSKMKKK